MLRRRSVTKNTLNVLHKLNYNEKYKYKNLLCNIKQTYLDSNESERDLHIRCSRVARESLSDVNRDPIHNRYGAKYFKLLD